LNLNRPDQIKRNVIAASIPLNFKKGTAYARGTSGVRNNIGSGRRLLV
jgi:P2-related tail formation protein